MLQNYLKIAWRTLAANKMYALINIIGLAVGLAACIVITLYIRDELLYDQWNTKRDRIYRVEYQRIHDGQRDGQLFTPSGLAPTMRREIPEIETTVRLFNTGIFAPVVVNADGRKSSERHFYYADSTVFDVFSLHFILGSPQGALSRPNTIVINRSTAQRYFGGQNPLGKTIVLSAKREFEVTGVIEDMPARSHFHADFFAAFHTLSWGKEEVWGDANFYTYVLMREGQTHSRMQEHVKPMFERLAGKLGTYAGTVGANFEPLSDVYLRSRFVIADEPKGDIQTVYILSAVAVLLLLTACINYMNLATARSERRAREVGIRKSVGAHLGQIAAQFYLESVMMTGLSMLLAIVIAELALPSLNLMVGKSLGLDDVAAIPLVLIVCTVWLVVAFLAGSYPALYLSSVQPITVLKGRAPRSASSWFRQTLVVVQFTISIALIVGTIMLYHQLEYVQNKHLGFDKNHVAILPIGDAVTLKALPVLKNALLQTQGVKSVSACSATPSDIKAGYGIEFEGLQPNDNALITALGTDEGCVQTLGLTLLAGKGLPPVAPTDSSFYYLVNEAAVQRFGWTIETAVGKTMNLLSNRQGRVVGVIKDFHFVSLHEQIEPLALFTSRDDISYLLVKISPQALQTTIGAIEQVWREIVPHRPFDLSFVDQELDALYRSERTLTRVLVVFAGLTIIVACLGLFALAAFMAELRTKEIGVRKVLGATESSIIMLLSKDFLKLVGVAFALACPIAWWGMSQWLQDFAYRVELKSALGIGVFVSVGVLAALIAFLTVAGQAWRAARMNPVNALRSE